MHLRLFLTQVVEEATHVDTGWYWVVTVIGSGAIAVGAAGQGETVVRAASATLAASARSQKAAIRMVLQKNDRVSAFK